MKDFKDSLVSGFAWQASTKLFVQIFSWVSTIWVARLLVPEDYGLVAMSGIVTGVFLLLATSGLAAGVVNRKEITKGELDTVFWLSALLGAVLYTIMYFVAEPAAEYFENAKLTDVVKIAGLMVLFSSLKLVPYAIALRNLNYKMISVTEMVGAFVGIAVTLVLAIYGFQYWSLVVGTVSAEVFMTIAFFVYYKYAPKLKCNIGLVNDLLRFGGTLLVSRALSYVSSNIPLFFLSTFTNAKVTGHFQMAQTFANLPSSKIGILFNNLIFPAMSRIKDDGALTKSTFLQMHTSLLFVTAPMFFGLALVSEPLIHVVLTEAWYPIIDPFRIICAIAVIRLSSQFITRAIEGLGDPSVSLKHQIYAIALYGPSLWFAVSEWGLEGMLLTWLLLAPILYLYLLRRITRVLKLRLVETLNMYVPIGVCILIMSASVVFVLQFVTIEKSELIQLIASVLVGAISFAIAAAIFSRTYVKKLKSIIQSTLLKRKR